jgi:hypothetical protein
VNWDVLSREAHFSDRLVAAIQQEAYVSSSAFGALHSRSEKK